MYPPSIPVGKSRLICLGGIDDVAHDNQMRSRGKDIRFLLQQIRSRPRIVQNDPRVSPNPECNHGRLVVLGPFLPFDPWPDCRGLEMVTDDGERERSRWELLSESEHANVVEKNGKYA